MKYEIQLALELPRSRVIELFDDPENLKKWQTGLQDFEHIAGRPGQVGSKSRLKYQMGRRQIEMIETITRRDLPNEFLGIYETAGMWNEIQNSFREDGPNRTVWIARNEFRGTNLLMKAMALIIPGAFRKQSLKTMEQFKSFAEGQA